MVISNMLNSVLGWNHPIFWEGCLLGNGINDSLYLATIQKKIERNGFNNFGQWYDISYCVNYLT